MRSSRASRTTVAPFVLSQFSERSTTMQTNKKAVTMVIDGACSGNPGPGGWACMLRLGEQPTGIHGFRARDHEQPHGTQNCYQRLSSAQGSVPRNSNRGLAIRPTRHDEIPAGLEGERLWKRATAIQFSIVIFGNNSTFCPSRTEWSGGGSRVAREILITTAVTCWRNASLANPSRCNSGPSKELPG